MVTTWAARLCWNSKCWCKPTGEAAELETGTWAAQYGLGHEEWLFRNDWIIDGWKYGWVQGITKSAQVRLGSKINLRLYAIPPTRGRVWIGTIRDVEVLGFNSPASRRIQVEYRRRGWLAAMKKELAAVNADPSALDIGFVNIRFKPENVSLEKLPYRRANAVERVNKFDRYDLYAYRDVAESTSPRSGVTSKNTARRRRSNAGGDSEYDPIHDMIQSSLYDLLVTEHGKKTCRWNGEILTCWLPTRVEAQLSRSRATQMPH